jgi:hypothetical protein
VLYVGRGQVGDCAPAKRLCIAGKGIPENPLINMSEANKTVYRRVWQELMHQQHLVEE